MKKKKFLFGTIALLGLAIVSLFTSPIKSNATTETSEELTDMQLLNYMQTNNSDGRYEMFNFVDSLNKTQAYRNINRRSSVFKPLPSSSFTFKEGHAYIFEGYFSSFTKENANEVGEEEHTADAMRHVFNSLFPEGNDNYTVIYDAIHTFSGSDLKYWYTDIVDCKNAYDEAISKRMQTMVEEKVMYAIGYMKYYPGLNGGPGSYAIEEEELRENEWYVIKVNKTFTMPIINENYPWDEGFENYPYFDKRPDLILTEYTLDGGTFDLTAPVPDVPGNIVVNVDNMQTEQQILSHIVATDDTDKNPQIVVKSSAYAPHNRITGTYPIIFYVQDAAGNKSIDYTLNVVVADVTDPSITNFGTHAQPNNVRLSDQEIMDKFTVSDNYSSLEHLTKILIRNDYAANWNVIGSYPVVCRVTDEAGNFAEETAYIQVEDKVKPTISGSEVVQPNNLKLTEKGIYDLFTVTDDVSSVGDIVKTLLIDGYSAKWNVPGVYTITCRATDEAGNVADATATITVEDKTKPTISGKTQEVEYSTVLTDLKALFTYYDDVSLNENILFSIISDQYSDNSHVKGNYTVTARVTDEAGNSNEASLVIQVFDKTKPIITAPTEVIVGNSAFHSEDELRSKISVVDGYDGVILDYTISDDDDYANNYVMVGKYKKTITASDESGNTQTLIITYLVEDKTSPNAFYDKHVICLSQGEELTHEMIKSYAAQSLNVSEASILSIDGEYNTDKVGSYALNLYMIDGTTKSFSIKVGTKEEKDPVKFDWKHFFSSDITNWNQFNQWPAWSICVWLSWVAISIASLAVTAVVIAILVKLYKKFKK